MGRPRRTGPLDRSQAWLRLCKNNDSLKKLIPIYFPGKVSEFYFAEQIKNEGILPSDAPAPHQINLRKRKPLRVEKLCDKIFEPDAIDRVSSEELHKSVDYQIIRKSLTASPIHWKAMPQFRNLTRKHISAICGSIIQKRAPLKLTNFRIVDSRKVPSPSRSPLLESVDLPPSSPPEKNTPSVVVKREPHEDTSDHEGKEVATTPSSTPTKAIIPKPQVFCRYCGGQDNLLRQTFGGIHYICHSCKEFLSFAIKRLMRLEDAVCIHTPPCRTVCPVDGDPAPKNNTADANADTRELPPSPMLSAWCSACRLFRCLQLGFRPPSLKEKRSPHSRLIRSLTITELSQPELIFRAQERRPLQFWNISHHTWEAAFAKPLEGEVHDRVSSFFDRLWIRAVNLCGHPCNSATTTPTGTQFSEDPITKSNALTLSPPFQKTADADGVMAMAETALGYQETTLAHTSIEAPEVVPGGGKAMGSKTDTCSASAVKMVVKCEVHGPTTAVMDSFEDLVEPSDRDKTETVAAVHQLNSSPTGFKETGVESYLLFCVSCAEPFHFYCVERQFRPRSKDHYVCRNCTACLKCGQLSAELKCIRCSHGFHPSCLPNYAPALSTQRGKWACPDCTHCLHCLVKPTDLIVARQRTGDASATLVPWSSDTSKCADCNDAEANGQICPECNRAYLRDTLEMVQCDSCRLWRHRACAKLTVDQYELIAQLSPSQLKPFTIYCSKCKEKSLARAQETRSAAIGEKVNGDERLRCLARDTLLERMQNLVHSCRRSPTHEGPCNTPARRTNQPNGHPADDGCRFELPQFDGGVDSPEWGDDHQPEVVNMPESLFDHQMRDRGDFPVVTSPLCATTSQPTPVTDDTFAINSDPISCLFTEKGLPNCQSPELACETVVVTTTHSKGSDSSSEEDPFSGDETYVRDDAISGDAPSVNDDADYEASATSSSVGTYRDGDSCRVPAWTVRIDLDPPPMPAAWLTEGDTFEYWITPRSLAYSLLARLIQRLSCTATTSPEFIHLRRLLQWLVSCVERLFPWMPAGECIDEGIVTLIPQSHFHSGRCWLQFTCSEC
nr:unnamed protein product [Spirometra erinaceieuropaei]